MITKTMLPGELRMRQICYVSDLNTVFFIDPPLQFKTITYGTMVMY